MNVTNKRRLLVLAIVFASVWIVLWQIRRQANLTTINRKVGAPVVVGVYYEALCPDSKNFIIKQLVTTYRKLPEYVEFSLVPYGKAETTIDPKGDYIFTCQHGPRECYANMYHACAIDNIKDNNTILNVISCMIRDNFNAKEAMVRCIKEYTETDKLIDTIDKCFNSKRSKELLKLNGDATKALRPSITFVPTITLDGSQGTQTLILKNLYHEVCKVLAGNGPMPSECNEFV